MANSNDGDAVFRKCLLWLAALIVVVGMWTHSFQKMVVTYFIGMAGIAGILLPDWDFFDREISLWNRPLNVDNIRSQDVVRTGSTRFRFYAIRTVVYAAVYAYGFYKWWTYVSQ